VRYSGFLLKKTAIAVAKILCLAGVFMKMLCGCYEAPAMEAHNFYRNEQAYPNSPESRPHSIARV